MISDESFFQTILVNNRDLKIRNDHLRYIDWGDYHPKSLGASDFEAVVNSGKHFGRKFDLVSEPEIFDMLDKHLGRL